MEFGEINHLFDGVNLLLCDVLASPTCAQSFQIRTNHVDVMHILVADACDIGAFVRDNLYKSLELQLTQCLADGGSGNAQLLTDGYFLELLVFGVFAGQNVLADLGEHHSPKGIFIRRLLVKNLVFHDIHGSSLYIVYRLRGFPAIPIPCFLKSTCTIVYNHSENVKNMQSSG